MKTTPAKLEETAIGQVLNKFIIGDASLFNWIADDIDFRIDHFGDGEADTSWQQASSREGLKAVIGQLGQEVFPKGTDALGLECFELGHGWHLTCFEQQFFYGVRQRNVTSKTFIISHETNGLLDFFRETVTDIKNV